MEVSLTRPSLQASAGCQDTEEGTHTHGAAASPQALGALLPTQTCFVLALVMMSAFSIHCRVTDPHEFLPCACASLIHFYQHPPVIYY